MAEFEVYGDLGIIPNDAVAIMSDDNTNPTVYIGTQNVNIILPIVDRSYGRIRFAGDVAITHGSPWYLGIIVSADRQTIYWTNNTQPMPQN